MRVNKQIRVWARVCFFSGQSLFILVLSNQVVSLLTKLSEKSPHLLTMILESNYSAILPQSLLVSLPLSLGLSLCLTVGPERQFLRLCHVKKETFSFSKQNYCERRWNQDILVQISNLPLFSFVMLSKSPHYQNS